MMDKPKRLLIVDNHPALREGLKSLLSPLYDIVGEAADGMEALILVDRLLPDLVLMDQSMLQMDGITATREIKKKWPLTKILLFIDYNTPEYMTAIFNAGADGYLFKDSPIVEFFQSIKDILDGKQGLHTSIMEETPR